MPNAYELAAVCSGLGSTGQGKESKMRSELGKSKLDKQTDERNKKWLQHMQRMSSERFPEQHILSADRKT